MIQEPEDSLKEKGLAVHVAGRNQAARRGWTGGNSWNNAFFSLGLRAGSILTPIGYYRPA